MIWVVHDALEKCVIHNSTISVRVGVSGEYRPLRMPCCKSACRCWQSAADANPTRRFLRSAPNGVPNYVTPL